MSLSATDRLKVGRDCTNKLCSSIVKVSSDYDVH